MRIIVVLLFLTGCQWTTQERLSLHDKEVIQKHDQDILLFQRQCNDLAECVGAESNYVYIVGGALEHVCMITDSGTMRPNESTNVYQSEISGDLDTFCHQKKKFPFKIFANRWDK